MTRPRIPGGAMRVSTARKRWNELREAAQDGTDPNRILTAVNRMEGIVDTMLLHWECVPEDEEKKA